nr:DNA repair protein RecN-like [Nerophis lumbriciformis]
MLRDLHIRNLAVLAEASIEFGAGFNVITGETGAGKSIVVDSLALLAGARASTDLIRTGAEALTVSGVFEPPGDDWRQRLESVGVETAGDQLVVRREISRTGRNRVFVNDQPVTVKLLGEIVAPQIRIHGQREELGLVAPDLQRAWLDRSGGSAADKLLAAASTAYQRYLQLAERLAEVSGDQRAIAERADFLRFQIGEIDSAEMQPGEDQQLRGEREVLRHSEAIQQAISGAVQALAEQSESAYETLQRAGQQLAGIAVWEPRAEGWAEELEELRIRVGELETTLGRRLDQVESDPGRLNEVESRLAELERLLRKYGESCTAVLGRREELAAELADLAGDEDSREALQQEAAQAFEGYRAAASKLSESRRTWAGKLEKSVRKELADLALERARFAVALERRRRAGSRLQIDGAETDFGEQGYDRVVYRFSPNPGEDLRPLAKVASGGELSRLYLSVQLASRGAKGQRRKARQQPGPGSSSTMVFDEVDAGVGGAEAAALGGKLRRLAQGGQILAVTHLPQVASCADLHFKVSKAVRGGRTHTEIALLSEAAQAEEIARMLGGSEVTELSLQHARELIAGAVDG